MQLTGIHHLNRDFRQNRAKNLAFYTGLLGMRWSRRRSTRTMSAPIICSMRNGKANPGTDLTFFDFPAAPELRRKPTRSRGPACASPAKKALGFLAGSAEGRRAA